MAYEQTIPRGGGARAEHAKEHLIRAALAWFQSQPGPHRKTEAERLRQACARLLEENRS